MKFYLLISYHTRKPYKYIISSKITRINYPLIPKLVKLKFETIYPENITKYINLNGKY